MTGKFHWLLHWPAHLQKWGCLPACFIHERKHRVAKRYGSNVTNTRQYEKILLYEIMGHDIARLTETGIFAQQPGIFAQQPVLEKNCKVSAKMKSFLEHSFGETAVEVFTCATAKLVPAGSCHRGNLALLPTNIVAEIWFHASFNGNLVSLVCKYTISE